MGTQFRLLLYAETNAVATSAASAAFARIAELDARLSDYSDNSDLSMVNAAADTGPVPIGTDLFAVLQRALAVSRQTDGAFDVTVGPAVRLWRRARRRHRFPSQANLDAALQRIGYEKVLLDAERRTVHLAQPGMRLDLGGIAKGYACDEALKVLRRHGIDRALVDGGGDITLGNPPPDERGWKVTIEVPPDGSATDRARTADVLVLQNCGVATSGDTHQFVELAGKRYSHIVDPRTARALTQRRQVTVIAADGTAADALASALSVLGPRRGIELVDQTGDTAAVFYIIPADGLEPIVSKNWCRYADR